MNDGEFHITYSYIDTSIVLPGTTLVTGNEAYNYAGAPQFRTMTTETYGKSKFL